MVLCLWKPVLEIKNDYPVMANPLTAPPSQENPSSADFLFHFTYPGTIFLFLYYPVSNELDSAIHSYSTYTSCCWEKYSVEKQENLHKGLYNMWTRWLRIHPTQFLLNNWVKFTVSVPSSPISPFFYHQQQYMAIVIILTEMCPPRAHQWFAPCNVITLTSKF